MGTKFLGLELKSKLILAPLAGVSDSTYRYFCHREGSALSYTEMVSVKGLYYKSPGTEELLKVRDDEGPVAVQLFGSEPEIFDYAIRRLSDYPFAFFDINMGCPVPKVVKNNEGSALLKNVELAQRIVESAVNASNETSKKPVTVKMRIGIGDFHDYVGFAKAIESAGAAAIAVHGRTRESYYSGTADWDAIKKIKENVSIPVIGNGDIKNIEDAQGKLEYSGCDLAMIGRASMGNPWVFSGKEKDIETISNHFDMLLEDKGEKRACLLMRKYFAWYTKGIKGANAIRAKVNESITKDDIRQLISLLYLL